MTILCADGSISLEVLETNPKEGTVRVKCLNTATLGYVPCLPACPPACLAACLACFYFLYFVGHSSGMQLTAGCLAAGAAKCVQACHRPGQLCQPAAGAS